MEQMLFADLMKEKDRADFVQIYPWPALILEPFGHASDLAAKTMVHSRSELAGPKDPICTRETVRLVGQVRDPLAETVETDIPQEA